jgi:hypothetical protein
MGKHAAMIGECLVSPWRRVRGALPSAEHDGGPQLSPAAKLE